VLGKALGEGSLRIRDPWMAPYSENALPEGFIVRKFIASEHSKSAKFLL
jgi:hypothetical protein